MIKRLIAAAISIAAGLALAIAGPAGVAPAASRPAETIITPRAVTPLPTGARPHGVRAGKSYPGALTPFTCPCYYYTQDTYTVPAAQTFGAVKFSIWKPTLTGSDAHSLAELAVADSTQSNIIEVGWNVDPGVNGDSNPHLFVYHWVAGVQQCYNGCGWVDNGAVALNAGGTLTASDGTAAGLKQMWFTIRHSVGTCGASASGWWIAAYYSTGTTQDIGCYPDSRWAGGLTNFTRILGFGELAAATTTPTSWIGSGQCATVANVNTTAILSSLQTGAGLVSGTWFATDSTKWSVNSLSGATGYFGGDSTCP